MAPTSFSSLTEADGSSKGSESSPLIVGAWKLVCNDSPCPTPVVNPVVDGICERSLPSFKFNWLNENRVLGRDR